MTPSLLRTAFVAASLALATPAVAQEIKFDLVNVTGFTLVEFYASPVTVDTWEEDLLGADVLETGMTAEVVIEGDRGCDYDMLFIFEDGDEVTDTLDLCEVGEYTLE
jgi:hypothetical protein